MISYSFLYLAFLWGVNTSNMLKTFINKGITYILGYVCMKYVYMIILFHILGILEDMMLTPGLETHGGPGAIGPRIFQMVPRFWGRGTTGPPIFQTFCIYLHVRATGFWFWPPGFFRAARKKNRVSSPVTHNNALWIPLTATCMGGYIALRLTFSVRGLTFSV